jgi:hypothetical protein
VLVLAHREVAPLARAAEQEREHGDAVSGAVERVAARVRCARGVGGAHERVEEREGVVEEALPEGVARVGAELGDVLVEPEPELIGAIDGDGDGGTGLHRARRAREGGARRGGAGGRSGDGAGRRAAGA